MNASAKDLIVFDMDGVLVDVSDSYRESIRQTVAHFTGIEITRETIQDYKNSGGWNNDWALSQKIIADLGLEVDYDSVVHRFQSVFFGNGDGSPGLIERERWIATSGLLEKLAKRFDLAIFTGRLRAEADITLKRFVPDLQFSKIVADDDVTNSKPAPDGLLMIAAMNSNTKIWYVGDTVDDARSARAANIPFIGIAEHSNPRYSELVALLKAENAIAVLDSINELETVI
jgi:HAD superfamily hydrolase (TIGR01548 family)